MLAAAGFLGSQDYVAKAFKVVFYRLSYYNYRLFIDADY